MKNNVEQYIDNLIRENHEGYELNATDLNKKIRLDAVNYLYQTDEDFRDSIDNALGDLIDARLGVVKREDYEECGLTPFQDRVNGERRWA